MAKVSVYKLKSEGYAGFGHGFIIPISANKIAAYAAIDTGKYDDRFELAKISSCNYAAVQDVYQNLGKVSEDNYFKGQIVEKKEYDLTDEQINSVWPHILDVYHDSQLFAKISSCSDYYPVNVLKKLEGFSVKNPPVKNPTTEGNENMKIKEIIARTKAAAVTTAELQAGKALIGTLVKTVKPQLPMLVRGYADHPLFPVIVALGLVAASEYLPTQAMGDKVKKAADLMLVASMMEGADQLLDVEGWISKAFAALPDQAKAVLDV